MGSCLHVLMSNYQDITYDLYFHPNYYVVTYVVTFDLRSFLLLSWNGSLSNDTWYVFCSLSQLHWLLWAFLADQNCVLLTWYWAARTAPHLSVMCQHSDDQFVSSSTLGIINCLPLLVLNNLVWKCICFCLHRKYPTRNKSQGHEKEETKEKYIKQVYQSLLALGFQGSWRASVDTINERAARVQAGDTSRASSDGIHHLSPRLSSPRTAWPLIQDN